MRTKIFFLVIGLLFISLSCDEEKDYDSKLVQVAKGLCAMEECVKKVSQAYELVYECDQRQLFGRSFKTMFENMARLSGSSRAMPNPLSGDYQSGDFNRWIWEEMQNPVIVERPLGYYLQGLARIMECAKRGVTVSRLSEEEFSRIGLQFKADCLFGDDEACEILCCGNPGITDYRACQKEENNLKEATEKQTEKLKTLIKNPNAQIDEEEKYWHLALVFLVQELLNYEEIEISVREAADLLSDLAALQVPKDLRTPIGEAAGKIVRDKFVEGGIFAGKKANIRYAFDKSSNVIGALGIVIGSFKNLSDYEKAKSFAQEIKTQLILVCLIERISNCSSVFGGLKKAVDTQRALNEYLRKMENNYFYQMTSLAVQSLVLVQSEGILAALGITAAGAGGAVVAIASVGLGVAVGAGFYVVKEIDDSILYSHISSLLYTLALTISSDSLDPQCLILKSSAIHTANSLMSKYAVGKMWGIQRAPHWDSLWMFFPTEKEAQWEQYLDDYFNKFKFVITLWEGRGDLVYPLEDLLYCREDTEQGTFCFSPER